MNDSSIPTAKDLILLPGPFTFKIFVHPHLVKDGQLRQVAQTQLGRNIDSSTLTKNTSRTGKYEAYSLCLQIETYQEIEALYRAFKAQKGVVMTL